MADKQPSVAEENVGLNAAKATLQSIQQGPLMLIVVMRVRVSQGNHSQRRGPIIPWSQACKMSLSCELHRPDRFSRSLAKQISADVRSAETIGLATPCVSEPLLVPQISSPRD